MIPTRRAARVAALLTASLAAAALGLGAARAQDAPPIASGVRLNEPKVRVDILSLKRTEGDTMTLHLRVVNDSRERFSITLGNMKLLDLANRRSYEPGLTEGCATPSGEQRICWAMFAAPPANVRAFHVKLYEDFDLIRTPLAE